VARFGAATPQRNERSTSPIARAGIALLRSALAQHHTTKPMKPHAIQPTSASGVAIGLGCADGGFGLVVVDAGNPLRLSTFATP